MKLRYHLIPTVLLSTPLLVFAAPSDLKQLFVLIIQLINGLIAIAAAIALLYFVWGLAKFILNDTGSEDVATKAKNIMLWGVIALFVLFSIWGIISVLGVTFLGESLPPDGSGFELRSA